MWLLPNKCEFSLSLPTKQWWVHQWIILTLSTKKQFLLISFRAFSHCTVSAVHAWEGRRNVLPLFPLPDLPWTFWSDLLTNCRAQNLNVHYIIRFFFDEFLISLFCIWLISGANICQSWSCGKNKVGQESPSSFYSLGSWDTSNTLAKDFSLLFSFLCLGQINANFQTFYSKVRVEGYPIILPFCSIVLVDPEKGSTDKTTQPAEL